MIAGLAALLGCQLAGEVLVRAFALPLPGPVAGLGLLFVALVVNGRRAGLAKAQVPEAQVHEAQVSEPRVPEALGAVSDALLRNLSLLFIPASVGVIKYLDVLRDRAVPILLAIAVSTTLALVVTAVTFRFVSRLHAFRREPLARDVERAAGLGDPEARP